MPELEDGPIVYRYLDFRRWLEDWFQWRQTKNRHYSYRKFAKVAGLGVGTLHNILAGRRSPSAESVARIARAVRLTPDQEGFFADLVVLTDTTDIAARNAVLERVLAHPEVGEVRRLEGGYVTFLSRWYHAAIHELAQLPGFRADPEGLAARLGHGVTPAEVEVALETLRGLSVLAEGPDGHLRAAEMRVETTPHVRGLAFYRHHAEMMALSTRALHTVPPKERYYGAVTVTLPASRFDEFQNELLAFLRAAQSRFDPPDPASDTVYQLNVQLFPLTRPRHPEEPLPLDEG
jgi:uncharacterized protein (TIGR02147 family)